MAQFDVFAANFAAEADIPYVIALQSELLSPLRSTVVAPLRRTGSTRQFDRLTPLLDVKGETFILSVTEVVSLPVRLLGEPVANLSADRDRIVAALDMLFTGI